MKRTGSAVWKGGIKDGAGTLSTESGTLADVNYSFAKRFGDEKGTNPEELVGAAHASCYAMQLSGVLVHVLEQLADFAGGLTLHQAAA